VQGYPGTGLLHLHRDMNVDFPSQEPAEVWLTRNRSQSLQV
jgi:hypothetical protein